MTSHSSSDPRRKARALALQCLFAIDVRGDLDDEEALNWLMLENPLSNVARSFAQELVQGVRSNLAELDGLIQKYAPAWPVQQLSVVDRNILRIALFELMHRSAVPRKTAANEAVELAKVFGSDSSGRFINGVAGSVIADLESGALNTDQLVSEGR
jgi:transcription antitermination protein NusB